MESGNRQKAICSTAVLKGLPPVEEQSVNLLLEREIRGNKDVLIVLDDDPTGTQTVHDVSVYTDWSVENIKHGLCERRKVFYLLTNSRAMSQHETAAVHREIAAHILQASRETGRHAVVMSRSDSTLRGHYPLETDLLRQCFEAAGERIDGEILCPFFKEGGRFTLHGVHYVQEGQQLVPAAQTEFARDATFGYRNSYLPAYIQEKTGGRCPAGQVQCISIETLRRQDYDTILQILEQTHDFGRICVDAADYCDIKVFAVALYRAMAKGKRFLFRTAAGLVKVMGGITDRPLLTRRDIVTRETGSGGVVIVGSHTEKTTQQLEALLELPGTVPIAFNSDAVLEGAAALDQEVRRCLAAEDAAIQAGNVAVCYTCRKVLQVDGDTKEAALERSVCISEAVQRLVGELSVRPAFLVAKGGITSSTVATHALGIRKALVLGQIQPGIPVWQADSSSKFPEIPYVVFPGNVGDRDTLRQVVEVFTNGRG